MRIAVAVHEYPPAAGGGVERVAYEQAEELAARGHEVFVFTRDEEGAGPDGTFREDRVGSVEVWRVTVGAGTRSPFSEYYEGRFLDDAFRSFLDWARPDVLHVQHLVGLSLRFVDLARERAVSVVVSLNDAFFLCHRLFLIDREGKRCDGPNGGSRCVPCLQEHGVGDAVRDRFDAMAQRLGWVDAVIAPSPSLVRRYEHELPFLVERVDVIEPGLARVPSARPRRPRGAADPLRLLYVGTLAPHKGLDVLGDAVRSQPAGRFSVDVYGAPAASDDAWLGALRARTEGLPFAWKGTFDERELESILERADVLVLPSRCDESWSRVVREARALGRAVVAPNVGGPADWLTNEKDALLVSPGSVDELASALERLYAEPELLERSSVPATDVPTVGGAVDALEAVFARAVSRTDAALPRVTVAYVTKNGAPWLDESLRAVRAQKGAFELVEILAVDSGSADESLEILRRHGARVIEIPPAEFGHGRTRNLAARSARGDVVAFLTQDACPASDRWLAHLLAPLDRDPLCAATWSLHVPRPDCHPMEWRVLAEHLPFDEGASAVQRGRGDAGFERDPEAACVLSNNAAAYRREVLLAWPFPDVAFGEDRAWARRVLDAGWRTALARDSVIRHSHAYSAREQLGRNFDHWRALAEDADVVDELGLGAGIRAAVRETGRDVRFWADHTGASRLATGARWAGPALLYHLGAFVGRWLGSRGRRLPVGLPERLSLHTMHRRAPKP